MHSLVKKKTTDKDEKMKKLSLLVTLLTYGDVDIDKATSAGETALHIATRVSWRMATQSLLRSMHSTVKIPMIE